MVRQETETLLILTINKMLTEYYIGIDPQPTLTAACIYSVEEERYDVYLIPLSTSKRAKCSQVNGWLNKNPQKIEKHLDSVFDTYFNEERRKYFPYTANLGCEFIIHAGVEQQMKKRVTIALETFIKAYLLFQHGAQVESIHPPTWQKAMLELKPKIRKDYAEQIWEEMQSSENVHIHGYDSGRYHDLVDAYLICQYMIEKSK